MCKRSNNKKKNFQPILNSLNEKKKKICNRIHFYIKTTLHQISKIIVASLLTTCLYCWRTVTEAYANQSVFLVYGGAVVYAAIAVFFFHSFFFCF